MYAIAKEFIVRGHQVLFATEQRHEHATKSVGLSVIVLDVEAADNTQSRFQKFYSTILKKYSMSLWMSAQNVRDELNILMDKSSNVDIVIGGQGAYVGPLIASVLKKKWVYCSISPLSIPSYYDPPLLPYVHGFQRRFYNFSVAQRFLLRSAKRLSRIYMSSLTSLRGRAGCRTDLHPLFEGMYSADLNLFLISPSFISPQPDWPARTKITGFTWFEPEFMRGVEKIQKLSEFFDAGLPPIVFALGGPSRTNPGDFFEESIKAAQLLGKRAIIVTERKIDHLLPNNTDFLVTGYVPYSFLISRALAVVHSGGIGAIGWCLKFGIPSLLIPESLDQFDNAYRAKRNKFVDILPRRMYSASNIARMLERLFVDNAMDLQLAEAKKTVENENGAEIACSTIESILI